MNPYNDVSILKEALNEELSKRNAFEQKIILSKIVNDLQNDLPTDPSISPTSSLTDEHYIKSDWEMIKEYLSIPFIRWAYILAIVTPIVLIVGFVYAALWVE
ncbi:hypothetical protein [Paenibacillus sp. Z6-24]